VDLDIPKGTSTRIQIIAKLRQIEILPVKEASAGIACKDAGISERTYYRSCKEYVGPKLDQAKGLKNLAKKNQQLKKLVAGLGL
jgi:putative transposase